MRWGIALASLCVAAHAQVKVDVTSEGVVRSVSVDGNVAARGVSLTVPRPKWAGSLFGSESLAGVRGVASGRTRTFSGLAGPADAPVAAVRLQVADGGDAAELLYEFVPRQDLVAEASIVRLRLPVGGLAGKPFLLSNGIASSAGSFPEALGDSYILLHDSGFDWFAWPVSGGTWLVFEPDWGTTDHIQIQDNRKFKADEFEIQVYLRNGKQLAAKKAVQGKVRLRKADGKELRAQIEKHLIPTRSLRAALSQQAASPAIRSVTPSAQEIPVYGRLEWRVDLAATYDNPFDPEDVRLDAEITGPDGRELTVPGYFSCPYERRLVGRHEGVSPLEGAGWRIRFCPKQPGEYRGRVVVTDGLFSASAPISFGATPAPAKGLVRVAKGNPLAFEFENGEPYFAIGENVCWPGVKGTFDYDNYWQRLADAGANYARIWVGPFDCFTLERTKRSKDDPAGLGRIDLGNAWRLDYVLDEAAKHGIQVMFCIDSFNSLRIKPPYARWGECPYNVANGGPVATPEEFFTNEEACKLFRHRLRYIVARWGANPFVLSWEFWNEVNIIEKYVSDDVVAWHREMARYLRSIDPHGHMITTSWAGETGDPKVDALPEMDYVQSHQYGARDAAARMVGISRQKNERFGKPHYYGEYGTGTRAEGTREDTDGIHLHNGLWSGVFAPAAGTAMLWWWDSYVEPRDLYHHFTPVAEFVRGIPYNTVRYAPLTGLKVEWRGTPPPARQEDLIVAGRHVSWSTAAFNQPRTVVCARDGRAEGVEQLSRLQHGMRNHPDLHNPVTFEVDYAAPGRFVAQVGKVSGYGGAGLRISVDGKLLLDKTFADTDEKTGELTEFAGDYAVEVPAGKHTVLVENRGNDWVFIDYLLPKYAMRTAPPVRLYGVAAAAAPKDAPVAMLWVKHEDFTWHSHGCGRSEWSVGTVDVTVPGLADGKYVVEVWDTFSGQKRAGGTVVAEGGTTRVPFPAFERDVAAKLFRAAP